MLVANSPILHLSRYLLEQDVSTSWRCIHFFISVLSTTKSNHSFYGSWAFCGQAKTHFWNMLHNWGKNSPVHHGWHLFSNTQASFMACLLSCSMDSGEGSDKMDLNWLFIMVSIFGCHFQVFHYVLAVQTYEHLSCVWWISRIFCCFRVWPPLRLEILCCFCMTNMPLVLVFI